MQRVRAHRRRISANVSRDFLLVVLAGGPAWLAYGIASGNPALMIGNSVGVLSSLTTIAVTGPRCLDLPHQSLGRAIQF